MCLCLLVLINFIHTFYEFKLDVIIILSQSKFYMMLNNCYKFECIFSG